MTLTIAKALARHADCRLEEATATLSVPQDAFGDLSSKIAFVLAGKEKKNPAEIAHALVKKLQGEKLRYVEKIETKGPYVNFYLNDAYYADALEKILEEKEKFGQGKKTKKKKIMRSTIRSQAHSKNLKMVEFFHANTHKGVHIGHIRTLSLGAALSNILEHNGDTVIRANYQGDIGPHVAKCLWGYLNLKQKPPSSNRGAWLGKVYSDASKKIKGNPALESEVRSITLKLYAGDPEITALWKETRQWCLDDFNELYREWGVQFDELYFESATEKIGKKIVQELVKKGVAKEDQGAIIIDLKDEGLGVAVLITKEGYALYFTKDIGLAQMKFDRYDLDASIHVVGKEQEFYFKQLFAIFGKIGMKKAAEISHHLVFELVMLPEGKMSSREGTMVLYADLKQKLLEIAIAETQKRHEDWNDKQVETVAQQIALGALKFSMVRRESNRVLLFDWDEALQLEGDTGPYVQYAYVRTNGILGKAKEQKVPTAVANKYAFSAEERSLLKKLLELESAVQNAARQLAPNHLAHYLLEVATTFNKFYTTSPVLTAENKEQRQTRLAMVQATRIVLQTGLGLLGMDAPERM